MILICLYCLSNISKIGVIHILITEHELGCKEGTLKSWNSLQTEYWTVLPCSVIPRD